MKNGFLIPAATRLTLLKELLDEVEKSYPEKGVAFMEMLEKISGDIHSTPRKSANKPGQIFGCRYEKGRFRLKGNVRNNR